MEAVADQAPVGQPARQREELRQARLGAVEAGVEAGHLGQLRRPRRDRADGRQIDRLVQRRKWRQGLERRDDVVIDPDWPRERAPAMDHPVTGGDRVEGDGLALHPGQERRHQVAMSRGRVDRGQAFRRRDVAAPVPRRENRLPADAGDLAPEQRLGLGPVRRIEREFEARRAGVDDEDGVGHGVSSRVGDQRTRS